MKTKRIWKYDQYGKIRIMAIDENYVMVRRPGCVPFVMPFNAWNTLSDQPITPPPQVEKQ